MPEQSEQDDCWDRHAQQPKQDSSAHIFLPLHERTAPSDIRFRNFHVMSPAGNLSKSTGAYFLTVFRTVSLAPPTMFCTFPTAFSAAPSAWVFASPVTLPN
jgi:hypothetical protein